MRSEKETALGENDGKYIIPRIEKRVSHWPLNRHRVSSGMVAQKKKKKKGK